MKKKKPAKASANKKYKVTRKNLKDLKSRASVKGGGKGNWIEAPKLD